MFYNQVSTTQDHAPRFYILDNDREHWGFV